MILIAASVAMFIGCGDQGSYPSANELRTPSSRLQLAAPVEIFGEILESGQKPQNVSNYSVRFFPKVGFDRYYIGSEANKVVTEATAPVAGVIECLTQASCGEFSAFDGFGQGAGTLLWDGVWTAELTNRTPNPDQTCTVDFAFNHRNSTSTNGNFFDQHAGDQRIVFNVTASGSCTGQLITDGGFLIQEKATQPLRAQFFGSPPTLIDMFVGDTMMARAEATGGFGAYQYAWKLVPHDTPNFTGSTVDFSGVVFTDVDNTTVTFSQPGLYALRYLLRDGDDVEGHGGNYALSPVCFFNVQVRPQLDAEAMGSTLPGVITQYVWYATSVTMKNVGAETWSGSAFTLEETTNPYWAPASVSLGTSVATNQSHTFNFNFGMMGPSTGSQNSYWSMHKNGSYFGDSNGFNIYVKSGSPEARLDLRLEGLLALFSPRSAFASEPWRGLTVQDDIVQVSDVRDFLLPREEIAAQGEFRLRYEAALDEPWDVDFVMYVEYDPEVFEPGRLRRGARGESHNIVIESDSPGLLVIRGKRVGNSRLRGVGLIFEIPLELRAGRVVPETFPRVALMAVR